MTVGTVPYFPVACADTFGDGEGDITTSLSRTYKGGRCGHMTGGCLKVLPCYRYMRQGEMRGSVSTNWAQVAIFSFQVLLLSITRMIWSNSLKVQATDYTE